MSKQQSSSHLILAGALLLIGLFVIFALILIRSQADTSQPVASIGIENEGPTIATSEIKICSGDVATDTLSSCTDISGSITLSAGATDSNTIVFITRDGNGTQDLPATAGATFFHSSTTNSCTDDNNDCYGGSGSSLITCYYAESVVATAARYRCGLSLAYYANQTVDSGSWNTYVTVTDNSGSAGTQNASSEAINKLVAGTFSNIAYSTKSLGYETGDGEEIVVNHYNNGNVVLDFDLVANSNLGCSALGTMPATAFKFDAEQHTTPFASAAYTLSTVSTIEFDTLDAAVRTNDASTTAHLDNSYWSVSVPSSGVAGTCQATITAVAEESA